MFRLPAASGELTGATNSRGGGPLQYRNLFLFWNAERMRRIPAARWRMRLLTRKERLEKWFQLGASVLTLLLIAGEILAHPLFQHEL
jgi:hypothetical protein